MILTAILKNIRDQAQLTNLNSVRSFRKRRTPPPITTPSIIEAALNLFKLKKKNDKKVFSCKIWWRHEMQLTFYETTYDGWHTSLEGNIFCSLSRNMQIKHTRSVWYSRKEPHRRQCHEFLLHLYRLVMKMEMKWSYLYDLTMCMNLRSDLEYIHPE